MVIIVRSQEYYSQRAEGGAGLLLTEGVLISPQGTEWPHAPGIWSDEQVTGWKQVTDAVHERGSHIFAQLWHVGRVAHPDMPEQGGKVCCVSHGSKSHPRADLCLSLSMPHLPFPRTAASFACFPDSRRMSRCVACG
jgi:2,4-dienoyl-CoA reductase-like NADH-dependent reductase (Old Yellow Enzyme family)